MRERRSGADRRGVGAQFEPSARMWRALACVLILMVLLGLGLEAFAVEAQVNLTWRDPTMDTAGNPLAVGDLVELRLWVDGSETVMAFEPGVEQWRGMLDLPVGSHCLSMTATGTGGRSGASNEACGMWGNGGGGVDGNLVIPTPPADFTLQML